MTWTVGQGQLPPILHRGRCVCIGAMGAGKTEVLARAAILEAIESPKKTIGVVAPTRQRLDIAWDKIIRLLPPAWVAAVKLGERIISLVNGARLQFVAAKVYSKDIGSPIQGQSWVAAFVDEEQDIDDSAMADVMMRGRDAPGGDYRVLSTCTLKSTSQWTARKAHYEKQPGVLLYRMEAAANPFVAPEYWQGLRSQLTEREYRMRVLALDARPERSTYPDASRSLHVRALPQIGKQDVTEEICGKPYLVGHDPGTLCAVSIILKAYRLPGMERPTWWVVGEVTTRPGHPARHAQALEQWLHERGAKPADVLMRADPHGDNTSSPHVTVYREYQMAGFAIKPAIYRKNARPGTAHLPGTLPKEARIQVVCTLLKSADGQTRLYIDADHQGRPVAPRLMDSLEMSERDESGKAEAQKKDTADLSHWPAALGYALFVFERPRLGGAYGTATISG